MGQSSVKFAMAWAALANAAPAIAANDPAVAMSLEVHCSGGITGRAGPSVDVADTGVVTLICPKPFASTVSPAREWRLIGTPIDSGLVGRLDADLDASGFDGIARDGFAGSVPDGLSCTVTRIRGAARHSVSIGMPPARDASYLSPEDRRGYEAVRTTLAMLTRATSPVTGTATANHCPSTSADPAEVQRRPHVTAICRHRSRSIFIQAQVDEDGTTTLWDWSFRPDQPPSSSWSRPPIPVTFAASPLAGAADLIASFDESGLRAADAPGAPDLICGLERASMQAGKLSVVRLEWAGLEPPSTASEAVRRTFDAIRRHTDALPDAGTFRLVEDAPALEP